MRREENKRAMTFGSKVLIAFCAHPDAEGTLHMLICQKDCQRGDKKWTYRSAAMYSASM